ncbi:MacB-like periplasmic core domain protein [uncultured archaeon]|nr:MacB-like periplasmic core domain protein [uncultured archaeon]
MASSLDLLDYSFTSLKHRSMRSWLTVLGIVIGIAAIVSLIAISAGLQASVTKSLDAFGSRTVIVIPGDVSKGGGSFSSAGAGADAGKLYDNDAKRLERIPGVEKISRMVMLRPSIVFKNQSISASVSGIEAVDYSEMFDVTLSSGRYLTEADRRVVIIGSNYADTSVFKQPMAVGSVVYLGAEQTPYRVIGVLERKGDSDTDLAFYIPLEDARALAGHTLAKGEVSAILFRVLPSFDFHDVLGQCEAELLSAHHISADDKDFSFITADFIRGQMDMILGAVTLFLGFVASISLLVGGVNVANTMFMTVLERTREIGTLKAIGASESVILRLFLIESALLGLGGGLIGALIGVLVSTGISATGLLTPIVSPELVFGACLFSTLLGLGSGFIPARNASRLTPVEALRFE